MGIIFQCLKYLRNTVTEIDLQNWRLYVMKGSNKRIVFEKNIRESSFVMTKVVFKGDYDSENSEYHFHLREKPDLVLIKVSEQYVRSRIVQLLNQNTELNIQLKS